MQVVKRTKTAADRDGKPVGAPAVHYATGAAAAGNVTGWSKARSAAAEFPPEAAARVLEFYRDRPNAGAVTAEGVPPAAPPAEPPAPPAPPAPAAPKPTPPAAGPAKK